MVVRAHTLHSAGLLGIIHSIHMYVGNLIVTAVVPLYSVLRVYASFVHNVPVRLCHTLATLVVSLSRRLNVSLWNVWGFLTPLILFAVFIGCLFSLHFVPWPC